MSCAQTHSGRVTAAPPQQLGWRFQTSIGATAENVSQTLIGLRQHLEGLGLVAGAVIRLELVLAEVLNNIVEHAYRNTGRGVIEITIAVHSDAIWCSLYDHGNPMPSDDLPPACRYALTGMEMQDLPEGGFGWALIRDLTTRLTYQRKGNQNLLNFRIDQES